MGRMKYSEDERNRIITNFLRCTREIIDLEGIDQVTIRKVAQCAGFNSATLYLYFKDLDELVTLASMCYLENYCRTLIADFPHLKTSYDIYKHTWRVFSQHAFANPQIFYQLFFCPHSCPLNEIVARYYDIYPNQLEDLDGAIHDMLLEGDLRSRNLKVLRPLAKEMNFNEKETEIFNDLTICYFQMQLGERRYETGTIAAERRVQKMMDVIDFFLQRCSNQ